MKWTRQRCQVAPTRISATARLRPRWLSEVTSRTPRRPAAHQLPQEGSPKLQVLGRTDVHTEDLPFAGPFDPDRDQDRHRDHPTVLPYLLEGGVQHQVGYSSSKGRVRKAWTWASSSLQIRLTWSLEMPLSPRASARASTERVLTPWT